MNASPRHLLAALLTLALTMLLGGTASGGTSGTQAAADPAPLTLRLGDVPRGWVVGNDSSCGPLGIEGAPPAVVNLVRRFQPVACRRDLIRAWGSARPFFVQGIVLTFAVDGGAEQAFAVAEPLLHYTSSLQQAVTDPTPVVLGDEARAFSQARAYLPGPQPSPAAAIVWRAGDALAIVAAGATSQATATAEALGYAQKQQARIAAPTPVSASDFDDVLVPLDNPKLGVPVWWLGRDFDPPGPLPTQKLEGAGGPYARGGGPGNTASLAYRSITPRGTAGIYVQIWKRPAWKRFLGTRVGHLIDSPCARQTTLRVRAGTAVIQRYWAAAQSRPCPKRPPTRRVAIVFAGSVVVTVNAPLSWMGVRVARPGAYDSDAGLEAVVRGLRRRSSSLASSPGRTG